jgi:hypothetical protein
MFGKKRNIKSAVLSLVALAIVPLATGCIAALPVVAFSGVFVIDLLLTPVRSWLGGLALDAVNTL